MPFFKEMVHPNVILQPVRSSGRGWVDSVGGLMAGKRMCGWPWYLVAGSIGADGNISTCRCSVTGLKLLIHYTNKHTRRY